MKIIVATPYLPWPLFEGGRAAQYRTFEALRDSCAFTLVTPVYSLEEEADARCFGDRFPNITLRPVRCFQPAPPVCWPRLRKAAVRILKKGIRSIDPSSQSKDEVFEPSPDYPFGCLPPKFVTAVEECLKEGCDIFQAEFAPTLTLGPLLGGRAPSVFVNHQLHFVYAQRFLEANAGGSANVQYLTRRIEREEAAYLECFDSAIVFSEVDRQALMDYCPNLDVRVSPFPGPEDPLPVAATFCGPVRRFVFIASELHRPNVDGLRWFMKEVWPAIKRKLPDASMEVLGRWSPAAQASLPNHGQIHFSGFVPDLGKALQNKIMIVPVWVGSGIRTKILAAWSACCPVVTTAVGMEGLPGRDGEHFVIGNNPAAFAEGCIELSGDIPKLNRIAANGLELVQKHYSLEAVRKTRLAAYEKLLAGRQVPKESTAAACL